ncbi:MAG TPA: class I SAM-dependent methyltransferase [Pyrinomonadaceae bacterium]|nr:class I SAM-dependent methyltransferase [Pyrinomonadaceae bacterium]
MPQRHPTTQHLRLHREILRELGHELVPPASILDFGCGEGATVAAYRLAGFDAWGCDIQVRQDREFLLSINPSTNELPFPNDRFDFVFSDQVLEHVRDHFAVMEEIRRVMKPGAISLHIFPARLKPREAHNFVPLAGVVQNYPWLLLWAFLGVRNSFQKGKDFREVARMNHEFLSQQTNYLSGSQVAEVVLSSFDTITFAERYMIKHSYGRARYLRPLLRFAPFVASLYSTFYTRVIFFEKNEGSLLKQDVH